MPKYCNYLIIISFIIVLSLTSLKTLSINLPVFLEITVLDDLGNIQKNCPVKIYETRENYYEDDEDNFILAGKTNEKGKIIFRKKLKPQMYYIKAINRTKTNEGRGVKTSVLERGKLNKITIIVHPK